MKMTIAEKNLTLLDAAVTVRREPKRREPKAKAARRWTKHPKTGQYYPTADGPPQRRGEREEEKKWVEPPPKQGPAPIPGRGKKVPLPKPTSDVKRTKTVKTRD